MQAVEERLGVIEADVIGDGEDPMAQEVRRLPHRGRRVGAVGVVGVGVKVVPVRSLGRAIRSTFGMGHGPSTERPD
jgi:hypothetical protein